MNLAARIIAMACKTALITAIIPALFACSNESSEPKTATVSLSQLQHQLGFSNTSGSSLSSPTTNPDDPAITVSLSVALGAMTVQSRTVAQGPYTSLVPITDLETQLETDLRNSANFIILRNLPTAEDTIEITIPEPGSKKFQIVAAALKTQPVTVSELGERAHQDSVLYIGFDERFLKTASGGEVFELDGNGNKTGEAITTISMNLIRACLVEPQDPPKGCAQYNSATSSFVVSDAVEVTGVYLNGESTNQISIPYVIRSGASGSCGVINEECSATSAATSLKNLLTSTTVTSVLVRTTHKAAGNASSACSNSAITITDLEANCTTQDFFTPL